MRYQNIRVGPSVYVSSTSHYFARVRIETWQNGECVERRSRDYCLGEHTLEAVPGHYGEVRYPNYVIREINLQLLTKLESGELRFFEYDRDRNQRFENLRYHNDDRLEWLKEVTGKLCHFGHKQT